MNVIWVCLANSLHSWRTTYYVPWSFLDKCMYAGFATAEESNKRYRYLIESGATGLSCAFDLPTQIGYDPGRCSCRRRSW